VNDREEKLAAEVLATLDGIPPDELFALAEGLRFGGPPASNLFRPLHALAWERQYGDPDDPHATRGWLTCVLMNNALHDISRASEFLDQIAESELEFWLAIHRAALELAEPVPLT
jgi:hypothetical protein